METTIEKVWSKSKLLVKAMIIAILILVLQIPTYYIKEIIIERETRQKEAIAEVSSRWAGRQNIAGPILVLPYWQYTGDTTVSKNVVRQYAYFLPDDLRIKSEISPEEKYRGIYKVMLYSSRINLSGKYTGIDINKLGIDPGSVIWNEAFVKINIADTKGLNNDVRISWNGNKLPVDTQPSPETATEEGIVAPLKMNSYEDAQNMVFNIDLDLSGSDQLLFTPLGKSTTVDVSAKWPHPSFTGDVLPLSTDIRKDSFSAQWKSIARKRSFPQQWKGNSVSTELGHINTPANTDPYNNAAVIKPNNISQASFGTNLFVPVNGYQKTMRSVKYAALCILLTFAAFFIIETTNRRSVHPFQYGLIGLALVLFYTLLLSFSEYVGFNISYVIASVCTIGLIAWFVKGLLGSSRLTVVLSVVLLLMYTYVFTILQLQDYALILGSIGLFITLAVIMHFSKKIQW